MRAFPLCLYLATLQPSLALRLQSSRPVISGTERLDPEELAGNQPIFVDAFLNQIEGRSSSSPAWAARIFFSYHPMYRCLWKRVIAASNKEPVLPLKGDPDCDSPKLWLSEVRWSCSWKEPGLSLVGQATMVEEAEVLQHDAQRTQGYDLDDLLELNESTNASRLIMVSRILHHAFVVGCSLPPALAHLQEWQLDVTATLGEEELYSRKGITVRSATFMRQGVELAMCTMVNATQALLYQWAKFHAQAGFDQILVYVEAENVKPVADQLGDLVAAGLVTLVPYFFGEVSLKGLFYMQPSMEQHCLYQAKGRATWLGDTDIDEFFELRGSLRQAGLKAYLNSLPKESPGVIVQSQFWRGNPNSTQAAVEKLPFPCGLTCKVHDYLDPGDRSKWIARPEMVQVIDPHNLLTPNTDAGASKQPDGIARVNSGEWAQSREGGKLPAWVGHMDSGMVFPNPESELRVNHFRHCNPTGDCTFPTNVSSLCDEDNSFAGYCSAQLSARLGATHPQVA